MAATFLSYAGAIWWCIAVALLAFTLVCGLAQPFVQGRRARAAAQPPVSVILPIKLLDPGFETGAALGLRTGLPGLRDPDQRRRAQIAGARRGAADRGRPPLRGLPLHPFESGRGGQPQARQSRPRRSAEARHDFILTKDSNITLAPDALAAFLRNFTPGVGLVVAVPVAVRAESVGGWIEASIINAHARLLLSASTLGLGFGVGKIMALRRSDLERAGGVAAMSQNLAEDTAISMAFARIGLKTVFAHETVAQEIGFRYLADVYHRQARWSVIRRANERISYPLEPLASPLPAALAAALAAPLAGVRRSRLRPRRSAGWFVAETAVRGAKGLGDFGLVAACLPRPGGSGLAAWLRGWTTHEVIWASRRFDARHGPQSKPEQG